mgnify:CR=1 FL=1
MNAAAAAAVPATPRRIALGDTLLHAPPYQDRGEAERDRFALYSMTAFGRGNPEVLPSARLSGKLARVQPGDVLLSRVTTEPRRAWVVVAQDQCMPLASSEWLVLRSSAHDPGYLRHVLVSNEFHLCFLQATAGAAQASPRSARLRALDLPLPSLTEQRSIARLLDLPATLRAKRRRALAALDELEQVLRNPTPDESRETVERLRQNMSASRAQLDALLGLLRDRAFRGEPLAA